MLRTQPLKPLKTRLKTLQNKRALGIIYNRLEKLDVQLFTFPLTLATKGYPPLNDKKVRTKWLQPLLTFQRVVSTKRSQILKQT